MTAHPDRKLPLQGVRNFRDFGGYAAGDRRMASGRFFRSAHHGLATDEDLARIAAMNIAAIVDLRRPNERERSPSRRWADFKAALVENHDLDEGAESFEGFMNEWDLTADHFRGYQLRYYERAPALPRLIDLYRRYFQTLAESEGPIVVHCAAGKDRTGLICALTHRLAGVHDDDIMADYLLTNDPEGFNEVAPQWAAEIGKMRGRTPDLKTMHVLLGVEADLLAAAFKAIDETYGGWDAYLRDALGVDSALRAKIEPKLYA